MSLIDDGTDVKFTRDDLKMCIKLVGQKAAKFDHIGMELGISEDSLEIIEQNYPADCEKRLRKVLDSWLKQNILRKYRIGGPKLSQLVEAIKEVDAIFAEGLLEKFKAMKQEEDEKIILGPGQDQRDEQIMDGPIQPQNPPNPEGIVQAPAQYNEMKMLVVYIQYGHQSMIKEAFPQELRYKPPHRWQPVKDSSCNCNYLNLPAEQTEIKVFHKLPTLHDSTNHHTKEMIEIRKDCSTLHLSMFVVPLSSNVVCDEEALVFRQYTKIMGAKLWQNTLVVIIQEFEEFRSKNESKRLIRNKIINIKKNIDAAFKLLGTPATLKIHPKFITIKDKSWRRKQPEDWKETLHKKMRETCNPSGMKAFDIMIRLLDKL